jgi:hypothetical protein
MTQEGRWVPSGRRVAQRRLHGRQQHTERARSFHLFVLIRFGQRVASAKLQLIFDRSAPGAYPPHGGSGAPRALLSP